MNEYLNKEEQKKKIVKDVIVRLHQGLSVDEAKSMIEEKVGDINSLEIAEIEQSLINEGMSTDEIKKFCNVHALLFESSLNEIAAKEESEGHPIYLFKLENREIEKRIEGIKTFIKSGQNREIEAFKKGIKELLHELSGVHLHYERKEQLLFPFLEKYGFMGPSKVMWGKDNEIRDMLKDSLPQIEDLVTKEQIKRYIDKNIAPLIEEIEAMIFKEENILFPSSQEKLKPRDWIDIIKESDDVGYVFIQKPKETAAVLEDLKRSVVERPQLLEEDRISFPTGALQFKEMMLMLNALPVDITFIDKDDTVKYFSDNKDRAFVRTRTVIGRKVQNCHPPQSVDIVEKILTSFKERKRDSADFWINFKDRFIYIKFFALRDEALNYVGTIEVTMDATEIRGLEGEKRLLDEGN